MGFKAEEAAPDLAYDFTRYGGGKGTSPEPSNEKLVVFQRKYRAYIEALHRTLRAKALMEDARLDEMSGEEAKAEARRLAGISFEDAQTEVWDEMTKAMPDEEHLARVRQMAEMVEEVFDGIPLADDIMKLPAITKARYFGWVVGQLLNPESEAAGTS